MPQWVTGKIPFDGIIEGGLATTQSIHYVSNHCGLDCCGKDR